jgi:hypothetical protein
MTFAIRDLSVLAYAQGFTLWHYKAADDGARRAAGEPGFFDHAADMLAAGDMVMVSSPAGARILCVARTDAPVMMAPVG